jgi:hypothetical protein
LIRALFCGVVADARQQNFFTQLGQAGCQMVVDGGAVAKSGIGVAADKHTRLANDRPVETSRDRAVAVTAAIVIERAGKSGPAILLDIIVECPFV